MAVLVLTSCARIGVKPAIEPGEPAPTPTPTTHPPTLEKTYGEIWYGGVAMLHIQYKDINIMVDPLFAGQGAAFSNYPKKLKGATRQGIVVRKDALPSFDKLPPADYLILTDLQPHHFGDPREPIIRKNMKVLAPTEAAQALINQGYSNVREMSAGQKLLLKKNGAFLFLTVVETLNSLNKTKVNGYLLEFDNGRNVFISGETSDANSLRSFLYNLRDDGKELHLAFLYGGGIRSEETDALQTADETALAEMASLLQPQIACLIETQSLSIMNFDEKKFRDILKEQLFFGSILIPQPGDKISF